MLLLLGGGVVANTALIKTKGFNTGFLFVNFGWGLGVFAGVLVAFKSGGQLNPAVTVGLAVRTMVSGGAVEWDLFFLALAGQMVGAFIGAVLCWLAYKQHFDHEKDPATILGVFSTGPQYPKNVWNVMTEAIATFVLVFVVVASGMQANSGDLGWLNALGVGLLVVGIGASLGGPTGYAINPARDLGPRIAHAVLPIPNKGGSDWAYSWVPVVGPLLGGLVAGAAAGALLPGLV